MPQKQLIPIDGVDQAGIIRDTPAHALPPNAWSDGRNIRFKDGTVRKREGSLGIFPELGTNQTYAHVAYWPEPNRRLYLEITEDTTTSPSRFRMFTIGGSANGPVIDPEDERTEITPAADAGNNLQAGGIPSLIADANNYRLRSGDWQTTLFTGGYNIIVNNGFHVPTYLNPEMNQVEPLPGWNYITDRFVSAKVVRGVGNRLVAGNFTHRLRTDLSMEQNFPGTVRISSPAPAGEIPGSGGTANPPEGAWNPTPGVGVATSADEFELSNTNPIVDIVPLQGQAIVYTTNSIHAISFPGVDATVRNVADGYGALTTNAVIEFDGRHLVVGSDDIYIFGGHPGSITSIADGKIREFFYNDISPTISDNLFIVRNRAIDEIQIFYPSITSIDGTCNRYLAWNYRNQTWSINDVGGADTGTNGAAYGIVGAIPGGGVVSGEFTVTGRGNTVRTGVAEQQTLTVTTDASFRSAREEIQRFEYSGTATSTFQDEQFSIGVLNDIVPGDPEQFDITFPTNFDSGSTSRTITHTAQNDTNTNVDNTGISVTVAAENRALTNATGTGATTGVMSNGINIGNVTVTDASINATTTSGTLTVAQQNNNAPALPGNPANYAANTLYRAAGGGYPRTLYQTGSDRTLARTVVVSQSGSTGVAIGTDVNIASPTQVDRQNVSGILGITRTFRSYSGTVAGITLQTAISLSTTGIFNSLQFDNAGLYLIHGEGGIVITGFSSESYSLYRVENAGDTIGAATLLGTTGGMGAADVAAGAAVDFTTNTADTVSLIYSITQTAGTGWSNNAADMAIVNANNGIVTFRGSSTKNIPRFNYRFSRAAGINGGTIAVTGAGGARSTVVQWNGANSNSAQWTITGITQANGTQRYTVAGIEAGDSVTVAVTGGSPASRTTNGDILLTATTAANYTVSGTVPATTATWRLQSTPLTYDSTVTSFSAGLSGAQAATELATALSNLPSAASAQVLSTNDRVVRISTGRTTAPLWNFTFDDSVTSTGTPTTAITQALGATATSWNWTVTPIGTTPDFAGTPPSGVTLANGALSGTTAAPTAAATAAQIATAIANDIIAAANATNGADANWTIESPAVGTERTEVRINVNNRGRDYGLAVSTNNIVGTDIDITTSNADDVSDHEPDSLSVVDPQGGFTVGITAGNGETAASFAGRIATALDAHNDWTVTHDATNQHIVITADDPGVVENRWTNALTIAAPEGNPRRGNFAVASTQATQVQAGTNDAGTITFIDPTDNTTEIAITLVGHPRESGATLNNRLAGEIATGIETNSNRWSTSVSNNVVTLTYNTADWVPELGRSNLPDDFRDTPFANRDFTSNFTYAGTGTLTVTGAAVRQGYPNISATSVSASYVDSRTGNTITVNPVTVANNATPEQIATALAQLIDRTATFEAIASGATVSYETRDFGTAMLNLRVIFDEQTDYLNANSYRRRGNTTTALARPGAEADLQFEFLAPTIPDRPNTDLPFVIPRTISENRNNDTQRPWRTDVFNLAREFVVVGSQNVLRAYNLGFEHVGLTPSSYSSYVERIHNPVDNEVEFTKGAAYMQLLLSDGDVDVTLGSTDSPGNVNGAFNNEMGEAVTPRLFEYENDYKVDFRRHGRLFNIRVEDPTQIRDAETGEIRDRIPGDPETPWRLAGYGVSASKEEQRGGRGTRS